jgi:hypothetical protein
VGPDPVYSAAANAFLGVLRAIAGPPTVALSGLSTNLALHAGESCLPKRVYLGRPIVLEHHSRALVEANVVRRSSERRCHVHSQHPHHQGHHLTTSPCASSALPPLALDNPPWVAPLPRTMARHPYEHIVRGTYSAVPIYPGHHRRPTRYPSTRYPSTRYPSYRKCTGEVLRKRLPRTRLSI